VALERNIMADDNVQSTDVDDQDADTTTGDDTTDKSTTDKPDTVVVAKDDKVAKEDFDKLFARMQAADRAKTAAEQKLADIEKAKMGDLERAQAERDEALAQVAALAKVVENLRIENAFHLENKYTWHDPKDALGALDMSGVEIGEDGKVSGLKSAIDDVAKRKPHFVKKDSGDPAPVASGDPANGQRKGNKAEGADRKALANRFPALNK
jgi:hypothetical protein